MHEYAVKWGLPDANTVSVDEFRRAYLAAVVKAGKAGTGIFGLRLQQEYVRLLSETLDQIYPGLPSDTDRFERAFGGILYLHLTRADKVAQAVSLLKAKESGLWHLNADGTDFERVGAPREPAYDFEAIHRDVIALTRADEAWTEWFDRHQIGPVRISYEALADHPAETLIDICRTLGVEQPESNAIRPGLAKLSDGVNTEWIRRYNADLIEANRGADPHCS
jgi:LPS sulfotransferase NodH